MAKYILQSNEVVLLKDEAVLHGKKVAELILTNHNLVVVGKGVLARSAGYQAFPVSQIKVHNGRAQALMTGTFGSETLEVYFLQGEEAFRFVNGGKKKVQIWIGKINEAVTGEPAVEVGSAAALGADRVAGALKDVMGAYKSFRGQKPSTPVSEARIGVAAKCVSCGAPVNGVKGQTITCTYCNAAQQL